MAILSSIRETMGCGNQTRAGLKRNVSSTYLSIEAKFLISCANQLFTSQLFPHTWCPIVMYITMGHQVWGNNWDVNNWFAHEMRNLASIERYVDDTFLFRPALVWFPQPIVSRIEESMATSTHTRKFLKPHLFIYLFISTRIGLSFIRSYSRSSQLLKLSPM